MVGEPFNWSYIYLEFRVSMSYHFNLLVFGGDTFI